MSNVSPGADSPRRRVATCGLRTAACTAPLLLAAACAAFPTMTTTADRPAPRIDQPYDAAPFPNGATTDAGSRREPQTLRIPGAAPPVQSLRHPATTEQIEALLPDEQVDAALAPQSIPQFVATVFGGVLGTPFTMTADVATRTEIISGGTGGTLSKRALFRLTQEALRQYGIDVYIDGAFVTVGMAEVTGSAGEIIRDRAPPQTNRRVVQFFPVQTIEVNVLEGLLKDLFPSLGGARISLDQQTNSIIISGPGREVAQVVRTLRQLDEPRFAGAQVLRVEPVFLSADTLATSLEQVLTTEGYIVSRQPSDGRAIVLLSFPAANQLLIFSKDETLLSRARFWVDSLDQPASLGEKGSTFVYQVKNTDAQSLGQMVVGQAPTGVQPRAPVGVPGMQAAGSSDDRNAPQGVTGTFLGGQVLTDPVGNRIIFTGTATAYAELRNLLNTLDTPAPQVVIEVMIAEVTLTDETSLGINFFGTETRGDGVASGGTEGVTLGAGGLLATFVGPEFRARLNAEASNNRINILQRPQLVVRSGGTARFQVGTDVPIITSQRATDSSSGGAGTDILQSVQYRQTGVILDIRPVVYGDRVDITISQENSSAGAAPEGISSPTILNRSLTTQIAISDGWTGVLGGLISNNYNKINSGVPFLKDIPLVGSAFQNNTVSGDRTELLILITPYIVRGDEDMADFAERYASDMNAAFRTGRGWSYTLTPFSLGAGVRGLGLDLPSASRASERPPIFPPRARAPAAPVEPDPTPEAVVEPPVSADPS